MIRFVLALLLCLSAAPALAQNPTCPDRPSSSNDNSCANTRWVKANGGGASVGANQYLGNVGSGTTGQTIPNCPTGVLQYTNGVGMACGSAAGLPSIADGHLIANATGGAHLAQDTAPSTWFDHAYCSTLGYIIVRYTGSWSCNKTINAEPVFWDSACTGNTVGVHNCTSAIASCIASNSPCLIRSGNNLSINSCITLAAGQAVIGQGTNSVVTQTTSNSCTFTFTVIGVQISNLSIVYQTQGTSGGYAVYENNTAGSGGNTPLTIIDKLFINKAYVGFNLANGLENVYKDSFILNATLAGVYMNASGVYLMKNVSAAGGMSLAALYIYGNSGGIIEGGEWESATGYGLDIETDGVSTWNFSRITNVFLDNPAKGNRIIGAYNDVFNDTYFSTSVISGPVPYDCLVVDGGITTQLTFNANQFPNCGENGIRVIAGSYLVFSSNQVLNNSLFSSNVYAGINIGAGVHDFEVIGNIASGPLQVYGVFVNNAATNGSVQNNLLNGNATGGRNGCPATVTCQANNY